MKILLLGEYSKLHNSLKAGLETLGHGVTLAGTRDRFKNLPVDLSYAPVLFGGNPFLRLVNKVTIKLFNLNLEQTEKGIRFYFLLPELKGFDHIQLINSDAIETHPKWSRFLLKKLFAQNAKVSLLICGDDTPVTDYLLKKKLKYSVLTPYFQSPSLRHKFEYVLKYSQKNYRKLYEFVARHSSVQITSDIDYKVAIDGMRIENTLIPNPVIWQKLAPALKPANDKVFIFLGINRLSDVKKGISFFEEALEVIRDKYKDKVEIRITENLPYDEYMKVYEKADILLDMVYAYDQGYNALEAMARGKVVFTGAEEEFLQNYGLMEDEVCINALPDVTYLVKKLSELIENPEKIREIGRNARAFVEREHDYIKIARAYLQAWKS